MIVVVDYGAGNLKSVLDVFSRVCPDVRASARPEDVAAAEKLVLPGVGFFDKAMAHLAGAGLIPALRDKVLVRKTPILGICLGHQLFTRRSEEGNVEGLGWFDAETVGFETAAGNGRAGLKVPHMGWNEVRSVKECPLLEGVPPDSCFYFAHSYRVICRSGAEVVGMTTHGIDFASVMQRENIFGVQFHPEKSHRAGVRIIENFAKLPPVRVLKTRVIPCLLLDHWGLVKTVRFADPTYIGCPINAARVFNSHGVDELILLDIAASPEGRAPQPEVIEPIAEQCRMPLTVGGGLASCADIEKVLRAGADKVAVNTHAHRRTAFVREAARAFGSQCVVASLDVRKGPGGHRVFGGRGREAAGEDPVDCAKKMQDLGAGEILLNSIDRDGTWSGYDLELVRKVSSAVTIPVIACGGAGRLGDFADAVAAGASAAAAGSFFLYYGALRAVLITFPAKEELARCLGREKIRV